MAQYEAYCVKCKAKREFEGEETTLKNGRRAAKGKRNDGDADPRKGRVGRPEAQERGRISSLGANI